MRSKSVLSGRLTDTLREAGLFEGFPSDTPLPTIWRGLKYRRGLEVEDRMDLAQTLVRLLVTATEGGTSADVFGHLLPPEVLHKQTEAKQEADSMNASKTALDFFHSFTEKWDAEHGE